MTGRYKWVALSNVTLGVLLATLDASIVLIAMPDIFRGVHLNPLQPGNSFYLLWMILGYLVVTSVLVVGLGRLGDLFGRVRMYTLGFAIYTVASVLLTIDWMHGSAGADWLIGRLERTRLSAPSVGAARAPASPQTGSADEDERPGWRSGRGATTKSGNPRRRARMRP